MDDGTVITSVLEILGAMFVVIVGVCIATWIGRERAGHSERDRP